MVAFFAGVGDVVAGLAAEVAELSKLTKEALTVPVDMSHISENTFDMLENDVPDIAPTPWPDSSPWDDLFNTAHHGWPDHPREWGTEDEPVQTPAIMEWLNHHVFQTVFNDFVTFVDARGRTLGIRIGKFVIHGRTDLLLVTKAAKDDISFWTNSNC